MLQSVTGVVLAGGKSSRMRKNKALLPYLGKKLIDAPIEKMQGIFSRVVLSVKDPADYPEYSLLKIGDQYPQIGPIGGITSTLRSGIERAFFAACDMPFLNKALIEFICSFSDNDAVIPLWKGRPEVLHAVYSASLLQHFEEAIRAKRYRITDAFDRVRVHYIEEEEIRRFDPSGNSFRNVNTPSDYEMI